MGSAATNMFSNSKISEFDPRGVAEFVKHFWNSKTSELTRGGGIKPCWESQIMGSQVALRFPDKETFAAIEIISCLKV